MRLLAVRTLSGPNVFGVFRPVVAASIDLGEWRHRLLRDVPALCERVLAIFPELRPHAEQPVAQVFLAALRGLLRAMSFTPNVSMIRESRRSHVLAVDFVSEHATAFLFRELARIFEVHGSSRAGGGDEESPASRGTAACWQRDVIERAKGIEKDTDLGPSTRIILHEAAKRGIPWFRLDDGSLLQLGYGRGRMLVNGTESQLTCSVSVDIACDKDLTKSLLRSAMIPVPRGGVARSVEEALGIFESLGAPVALKPVVGHHGDRVFLNLDSAGEIREHFSAVAAATPRVVVEECFSGRDYRVVVVGNRVVAACERKPPRVVGDGARAIFELIDAENSSPLRGDDYDRPLSPIEVDAGLLSCLAHSGLGLSSVPAPGETVPLREAANVSKGGTAEDVTGLVHSSVAAMCVRAARALGLDIAGVDVIAPDIGKPLPLRAGVIEVNAAPGISMHHCPSAGATHNVGGAIIDMLFPRGDGRVPIVSVTGTNGKTTTVRMIAHVLRGSGTTLGIVSSDGIEIAGERVGGSFPSAFEAARCVLADSRVDVALFELSETDVIEHGLPYDRSDVGIVTNWALEGPAGGVRDIPEPLVVSRSLIAQCVRDRGCLILDADDPLVMALLERQRIRAWRKEVALCALEPASLRASPALELNGARYLAEDGAVMEAAGGAGRRILEIFRIPATLGGRAGLQIKNAMFAVAACRRLGVEPEEIAERLATFGHGGSDEGRVNLYRVKAGHVLLDRARNEHAYRSVAEGIGSIGCSRRTCIVRGIDREGLRAEAETLAAFYQKIIVFRPDAAGGADGSGAFAQAIRRSAAGPRDCRIVSGEEAALGMAVAEMMEGELIAHFYDDIGSAEEVLREFDARRTDLPIPLEHLSGLGAVSSDPLTG